jgi:hypothetical protein
VKENIGTGYGPPGTVMQAEQEEDISKRQQGIKITFVEHSPPFATASPILPSI